MVQGSRVYAWTAVPSFPQIALCFPSFPLRPQPFDNSCDECQKILLISGTLHQQVSSKKEKCLIIAPLSTFRCSALFQHKCPLPRFKNCYWKGKGSLKAGPMSVVSHWVMIWALDGCLSWTCIRHRTAQWQWFSFWKISHNVGFCRQSVTFWLWDFLVSIATCARLLRVLV